MIVVRDQPDLHVFVLRRNHTLAFAPGATVFPGGAVDPDDLVAARDQGLDEFRVAAARECLEEAGIPLEPATLIEFARWITPEGSPRRYDTRFFVAQLPDGAQAQDVTTESSSAGWFGVGDALERAQRGEIGMLPPTIMTLASLAGFRSVADVIVAADERLLDAIIPTIGQDDSGRYFVQLPDGTKMGVPESLFPPARPDGNG